MGRAERKAKRGRKQRTRRKRRAALKLRDVAIVQQQSFLNTLLHAVFTGAEMPRAPGTSCETETPDERGEDMITAEVPECEFFDPRFGECAKPASGFVPIPNFGNSPFCAEHLAVMEQVNADVERTIKAATS